MRIVLILQLLRMMGGYAPTPTFERSSCDQTDLDWLARCGVVSGAREEVVVRWCWVSFTQVLSLLPVQLTCDLPTFAFFLSSSFKILSSHPTCRSYLLTLHLSVPSLCINRHRHILRLRRRYLRIRTRIIHGLLHQPHRRDVNTPSRPVLLHRLEPHRSSSTLDFHSFQQRFIASHLRLRLYESGEFSLPNADLVT